MKHYHYKIEGRVFVRRVHRPEKPNCDSSHVSYMIRGNVVSGEITVGGSWVVTSLCVWVKNAWSYNSIPCYVLMLRCLVKRGMTLPLIYLADLLVALLILCHNTGFRFRS